MSNIDTSMTLDDAVMEVLQLLTGLDLQYDPQQDRYNSIVRCINRALRSVALEHEWSWFSDVASIGPAVAGQQEVVLPSRWRARIINDDSVRLCDQDGNAVVWAYWLPRDALHKNIGRRGLWCSLVRQTVAFSRQFNDFEDGLDIRVPIMREPKMHVLPKQPETGDLVAIDPDLLLEEIDFPYPDLVVAKAAYFYASTDPIMQPRVQTLDANYKDLMYQIIERDDRFTDSPDQNTWLLPVEGSLEGNHYFHRHPLADDGRMF